MLSSRFNKAPVIKYLLTRSDLIFSEEILIESLTYAVLRENEGAVEALLAHSNVDIQGNSLSNPVRLLGAYVQYLNTVGFA